MDATASWVLDSISSPCIDAGDPTDMGYVYEPAPNGGRVNLGVYGGTGEASIGERRKGTIVVCR